MRLAYICCHAAGWAMAVALASAVPVTGRASGTFDVTLTPQGTDNKAQGATLGRSAMIKTFKGDLAGEGRGEMLTALTDVKGSAAYVAIEHVSGTLHGRRGTFVLQHTGTLTRGTPDLTVRVVPDSGTGALVGLSGRLTIEIDAGKHSYVLDYTLPEAP
jgi:hypothetical protein